MYSELLLALLSGRSISAPVCLAPARTISAVGNWWCKQTTHVETYRNMDDYMHTKWFTHDSAGENVHQATTAMVGGITTGAPSPQCQLSSLASPQQSSPGPASCSSCASSAKRMVSRAKVAKRGLLGARKLSVLSPARESFQSSGSDCRRGQAQTKMDKHKNSHKQKTPLSDRTNISLQTTHIPATPPVPVISAKSTTPELPSGIQLQDTQREPDHTAPHTLSDTTWASQVQQLQARNAFLEQQLLVSQARVLDLEARLKLTAQGAVLASVAALEAQSQSQPQSQPQSHLHSQSGAPPPPRIDAPDAPTYTTKSAAAAADMADAQGVAQIFARLETRTRDAIAMVRASTNAMPRTSSPEAVQKCVTANILRTPMSASRVSFARPGSANTRCMNAASNMRRATMSTGRAKQARRKQQKDLARHIREATLRQFGEWQDGKWVLPPVTSGSLQQQ